MAIIWNAARTTTVAALGTVAHTADAVSYLARTGSAYARDLHMTTELDLDQTRSDRMEATKHQRAIDHAHRMVDIDQQLQGNKKLQQYYEDALARYDSAEQDTNQRLQVAAE